MITLTEKDIDTLQPGFIRDQLYNGLDTLVTSKVESVLSTRLASDSLAERIYRFELSNQAPAFCMMLRGVAFDERACTIAIKDWEKEEKRLVDKAQDVVSPYWVKTETRKGKCNDGKPHRWDNGVVEWRKHRQVFRELDLPETPPDHTDAQCVKCKCSRLIPANFNPLSTTQVIKLLYDLLDLPPQYSRKGEHRVTVDDEALNRLIGKGSTSEVYVPLLEAILSIRQAHKQISFLKSRRSIDGRLRFSVNVGVTETGRFSSSKDPFREGTNIQNIADRSRNVIIADPGLLLCYADFAQAESKIIAYDAECPQDIEDHNAGDTHTRLCKTLFPELPWGSVSDKEVAQTPTPWDITHDYRFVAKKVRHGTNIGMQGRSIGREIHQNQNRGTELRNLYFERYPENLRRQKEITAQVASRGILISPVGRKRQFFGRLWDSGTQREGLSQTQQSTVADLLNTVMWLIWDELDLGVNVLNAPKPSDPNKVWLMAQEHDALLFQIRPHDYETLQRVLNLMRIPVLIHGKKCEIEVEVQLGYNFRHFNSKQIGTIGGLTADWEWNGKQILVHNKKEDLR